MWDTLPGPRGTPRLAGLLESWDEAAAQGAWAIVSFPREEAPGLTHRAGPSSQPESGLP